jgi:hypothetical protein
VSGSTRYDWRCQGNADHLARAFATYVAAHGRVCEGVSPTGCESHPSDALEPIAHVTMPLGGRYDAEVRVLCPFCIERFLAVQVEALGIIAARHRGLRVAVTPANTPDLRIRTPVHRPTCTSAL